MAQTVAVTPPEEEEKCPDVQEMFAVTGLGASGTHYIAQLLYKAGVAPILGCYQPTSAACSDAEEPHMRALEKQGTSARDGFWEASKRILPSVCGVR